MNVADLELGRLLRLKGATDSMIGGNEASAETAVGLTEGYTRLREQVAELVGDSELKDEFASMFPEVETFAGPPSSPRPRDQFLWQQQAATEARRAQTLLRQLAGWIDGLIAEQTLAERIKAEAAERVKLEQKRPPGFNP